MFVETRTSPDQVIADAWAEVEHMINAVLASVTTKRRHPTYNTKTAIRKELHHAEGAMALARRVGDGEVPAHIRTKLVQANVAVASL